MCGRIYISHCIWDCNILRQCWNWGEYLLGITALNRFATILLEPRLEPAHMFMAIPLPVAWRIPDKFWHTIKGYSMLADLEGPERAFHRWKAVWPPKGIPEILIQIGWLNTFGMAFSSCTYQIGQDHLRQCRAGYAIPIWIQPIHLHSA